MTEIPGVYHETLELIDAKCYGPYTFSLCTLSELLDLPEAVNRFNADDYTNPDQEWVEAMLNARELFRKKLADMKQTREWEESWNRFDKEDPPI